ncbi:hypothetical protein G5714_006205 [Onychostoma macrolepis]|uniref:Uncharacterized protein n=1 Tax=Onychostoma macrolepis TaxID=369639 RepID=A0A7J6D363_9TELE|nr:hypothetical protein G5714_006205 [Onychostoma macrolepis]
MADNYDATFENLEFDEGLEQILEEIFDEAQLVVCGDDVGLNGEHGDDDNCVIILPTEDTFIHSFINRYFERIFDLAGQPLSYREAEEIAVNAQTEVILILRNIISCQQQHTEALRHAAEFWRSCHEQLYNKFRQFQQAMNGVPEGVREQHTVLRLTVNALSLMSERLNLIQRMLTDLHNDMMSRRS